MERHVRTVHLKLRPYKCDHEGCAYAASTLRTLSDHKLNKHVPRSVHRETRCTVIIAELSFGVFFTLNLEVVSEHYYQLSVQWFDSCW